MRAMESDSHIAVNNLKVDGGMTACDEAMQIQANLLGKPLLRAKMPEATALGAAFAAGLAVGVWDKPTDINTIINTGGAVQFKPLIDSKAREMAQKRWSDAVQRSLNLDGSFAGAGLGRSPARTLGKVLRKLR